MKTVTIIVEFDEDDIHAKLKNDIINVMSNAFYAESVIVKGLD